MQQSDPAGVGSTSTLSMTKRSQGRWLRVRCQATNGPNLLLCVKLPDFSAQGHHPCPMLSSLLTADLLSKAYSHTESSWKEIHSASAFSVTCRNTARLLSSGSLLIVDSQETRGRIVLPSLAANKSSPTWSSLMERPKL